MVRSGITMAVKQCAWFNNCPKRFDEEALKKMCWYLVKTKHHCLVIRPDISKGLEFYTDADFAGSWSNYSSHDSFSVQSWAGFCIFYSGCPILWKSKIHSIIVLSNTEAKYVAFSSALRKLIAIIHLLKDLSKNEFPIHNATHKFACKTFEDNMSFIKLATDHLNWPRTKMFVLQLHHFHYYILDKIIAVRYLDTKNQIADILAKPLPRVQFLNCGLSFWIGKAFSLRITRDWENVWYSIFALSTLTRAWTHAPITCNHVRVQYARRLHLLVLVGIYLPVE